MIHEKKVIVDEGEEVARCLDDIVKKQREYIGQDIDEEGIEQSSSSSSGVDSSDEEDDDEEDQTDRGTSKRICKTRVRGDLGYEVETQEI